MTATALSWSGGKDSLLALLALESAPGIDLCALVTTVTDPQQRISMHGVRESLLEVQAGSLGLPLVRCRLPEAPDNAAYRDRFAGALQPLIDGGVTAVAFGDLYLADVRAFREAQIRALGIQARFPLWHQETRGLARRFVTGGHRAVVCCVDAEQLDPGFLGRDYDAGLLAELPDGVDPCGENGEFHTFAYDGPRFSRPIRFERGGAHVAGGRFHFLDLEDRNRAAGA